MNSLSNLIMEHDKLHDIIQINCIKQDIAPHDYIETTNPNNIPETPGITNPTLLPPDIEDNVDVPLHPVEETEFEPLFL